MFGGVNVWRIAEVKEIGEIKFGELIDFIHKDAIYMLNFGGLKFGEPRVTRQIRQLSRYTVLKESGQFSHPQPVCVVVGLNIDG